MDEPVESNCCACYSTWAVGTAEGTYFEQLLAAPCCPIMSLIDFGLYLSTHANDFSAWSTGSRLIITSAGEKKDNIIAAHGYNRHNYRYKIKDFTWFWLRLLINRRFLLSRSLRLSRRLGAL